MTVMDTPTQEPVDSRLGRIVQFDEKSRNYTIRQLLDERRQALTAPRVRRTGPTLDQGREGACVGFGCAHFMNAFPQPLRPHLDGPTAHGIYKEAQRIDPWPGENYEGTSVLAGVKILRQRGHINTYRWVGAGSQRLDDDVIETLKNVGPIIFGIPWYFSMFEPKPNGLVEIDPASGVAGGHCLIGVNFLPKLKLDGEDKPFRAIRLQNSWGADYGVKYFGRGGHVYMRFDAFLEHLLANDGEGCVPLKTTAGV